MLWSHDEFVQLWKNRGESQVPYVIDTAWARYQQVLDSSHTTEHERDDPTIWSFISGQDSFLEHAAVKDSIAEHVYIELPAGRIPWTKTDLRLKPGQAVSTFASGRVWRSRDLDLWLKSQFAVWFKIGNNGTVFNSTGHTNTFHANSEGELYVSNQFPGQFGEPLGGRLVGGVGAYAEADGQFQVLVVLWKEGVNPREVLERFNSSSSNAAPFAKDELQRIRRDAGVNLPKNWSHLWFIGSSSIFSLTEHESQPCMHCKPYGNVGILQKDFDPAIRFGVGTKVSWDWLIASLPSRFREDTTFTHDYLSVAFEFENGRDLTYTWSWELPKETGYWCPLQNWGDREYHVVIRSGIEGLGSWKSEERDLFQDYNRYIEEGHGNIQRMPKQITRAWFIAGNRWQRFEGEMDVKRLRITSGGNTVRVL